MMEKLILTAALSGTAIFKDMAPTVPEQPDEIAAQAVQVVKAGASVIHIHVRDEKGIPTMRLDRFEQTFCAVKRAIEAEGLDVLINLTSSGSWAVETNETRTAHLKLLKPELCTFDPGTFNWHNSSLFINTPDFLDALSQTAVDNDVKPEFEIFDSGMLNSSLHYIQKHGIKTPCHFQFVLGVGGAMDASTENLCFLVSKLPAGSTWSVTGIGKSHISMMLAGLSLGCTGLRVGLEDNLYFARGIKATNVQLVERAAAMARLAGRELATAEEARTILSISRHSLKEYAEH